MNRQCLVSVAVVVAGCLLAASPLLSDVVLLAKVAPPRPRAAFNPVPHDTCGIKRSPEFLSRGEIRHLLELVEAVGGWVDTPHAGAVWQTPDMDKWRAAVAADAVVQRLEGVIGDLTGIPPHDGEEVLSIARISPRGADIRGGHFMPYGLHHETDLRPFRAVTVLMYLTDVEEGGRTVFPLCGSNTEGGAAAVQQQLQDAMASQWGKRGDNFARHAVFDATQPHPFADFVEGVCRGNQASSSSPVAGTAILFPSLKRGKKGVWRPQPLTWHDGCNVVSPGDVKIIVQKFKELPESVRVNQTAVRAVLA